MAVLRPRPIRSEASITWRSAKLAAVRQYGEGSMADHVALIAVKRFLKRTAKRRGEQGEG